MSQVSETASTSSKDSHVHFPSCFPYSCLDKLTLSVCFSKHGNVNIVQITQTVYFTTLLLALVLTYLIFYKSHDKVTLLLWKLSFQSLSALLPIFFHIYGNLGVFSQNVAKGTIYERLEKWLLSAVTLENNLQLPFLLDQKAPSIWKIISFRKRHLYTIIPRKTGCTGEIIICWENCKIISNCICYNLTILSWV